MDPAILSLHDSNSIDSAPVFPGSESLFRQSASRALRLVAEGIPHAIFVIHVERLRYVTEQCGQEAGQVLLEDLVRGLGRVCGSWQAHCRLGVERIAILKQHRRQHDAIALAARMRDAINRETFCWHGLTFRMSATVGLLEMEKQPEGIDDLLGRAAYACVAARSLGGGGVLVLTGRAGEQEAVDRERAWREHIHETLV